VRVLLLNQFYPPDVAPTGQALHDLARALAGRGHEVHVVCSRAAYGAAPAMSPEAASEDGVAVHRLGGVSSARTGLVGRMADHASFVARLALASRGLPRPDVIVALATPPYLGLLASLAPSWRGVARVDWIMDVYPDVLAAHGALRRQGTLFRLLESRSRRQLRGAAVVIALGPFMARVLGARMDDPARLFSVPLWSEATVGASAAEAVEAVRRSRGWTAGELVLLYSGNMGRGHRLAEFLEAAGRLGAPGPRWAFAGGGVRRAEVESFARARPDARIQLLPYASRAVLRESLSAADVHLASLSAPWQGLIVPSKVQAAFAAARPVIFVGPRDNESAAWIEESGGGWVVAEGDVDGLLAAVRRAGDAAERARRGQAALAFARDHFDPAGNVGRIVALIEHAGAEQPPLPRV
jgi:putative colanic acid biosynthesis glycosyltransferase WcaI